MLSLEHEFYEFSENSEKIEPCETITNENAQAVKKKTPGSGDFAEGKEFAGKSFLFPQF